MDAKIYMWNAATQTASPATIDDILPAESVGDAQASHVYYMPGVKTLYIFKY
jgi:hypothetical protein